MLTKSVTKRALGATFVQDLAILGQRFIIKGEPSNSVFSTTKMVYADTVFSSLAAVTSGAYFTKKIHAITSSEGQGDLTAFNIQKKMSMAHGQRKPTLHRAAILADLASASELESVPYYLKPEKGLVKGQETSLLRIKAVDLLGVPGNLFQSVKDGSGRRMLLSLIFFEQLRLVIEQIFSGKTLRMDDPAVDGLAVIITAGVINQLRPEIIDHAVLLFLSQFQTARPNGLQIDPHFRQLSKFVSVKEAFDCVMAAENGMTCDQGYFEGPQAILRGWQNDWGDRTLDLSSLIPMTGSNFAIMDVCFRPTICSPECMPILQSLYEVIIKNRLHRLPSIEKIQKVEVILDENLFREIEKRSGKWPTTSWEAQGSPAFLIASVFSRIEQSPAVVRESNSVDALMKAMVATPQTFDRQSIVSASLQQIGQRVTLVSQPADPSADPENPYRVQVRVTIENTTLESETVTKPLTFKNTDPEELQSLLETKFQTLGKYAQEPEDYEQLSDFLHKTEFFDMVKLRKSRMFHTTRPVEDILI